LHQLALRVATTVAQGAGDATPEGALKTYKESCRLIVSHALRGALETYYHEDMVARCMNSNAKAVSKPPAGLRLVDLNEQPR